MKEVEIKINDKWFRATKEKEGKLIYYILQNGSMIIDSKNLVKRKINK